MFFYILQISYVLFRWVLPKARLTNQLFEMLKHDVYRFGGGCKHSGSCCSKIMLYDDGAPIEYIQQWKTYLQKNPSYYSFKPNIEAGQIQHFDCESLTCDNRCDRHQTRPIMCRNYPYSFFYEHGYIYESCGYTVYKDDLKFNRLLPMIKRELLQFSIV